MPYEENKEFMESLRSHGGPISSKLHILFDDYGNFQIRRKEDNVGQDRGYLLDCLFTHVEEIQFGHPLELTAFSLRGFRKGITKIGNAFSNSQSEDWSKHGRGKWEFEEHAIPKHGLLCGT